MCNQTDALVTDLAPVSGPSLVAPSATAPLSGGTKPWRRFQRNPKVFWVILVTRSQHYTILKSQALELTFNVSSSGLWGLLSMNTSVTELQIYHQRACWWTVWKTYSPRLSFSSDLWLPSSQQRTHIVLLSAWAVFYIPRLTATMLHFRAMLKMQQSFSVSSHPVCHHTGYKYADSSLRHEPLFRSVSLV